MTRRETRYDAIVVGGGHNGLVAAALLARAGRSVIVLERAHQFGGAAISGTPFAGVGARLSRYSYLVSLFPRALLKELAPGVELRRRRVQWYAPTGPSGALADEHGLTGATVDRGAIDAWQDLQRTLALVAARVFPTLTQPLPTRDELRHAIDDDAAWRSLFEEPLAALLESRFRSDLLRGVICTDSAIGTFASAEEPQLLQNRCFLYHVVGNGTGHWDIPVGGMGALTDALALTARRAGAELRSDQEAVAVATDGGTVEITCAGGERFQARHLLAAVAPNVLARLLGESAPGAPPEGSQLKINMLLSRLPRLRDPDVDPEHAFAGTFHVNEGYDNLQRAYREASLGQIPELPPCELYCHSLADPGILSPELRAAGGHTLTLFGLHAPARLFTEAPARRKADVVAATLRSVDSVLAEPLEECLWRDADGQPCIEALTPVDIERELAMPGGHIFHRDLAWPYAESEDEVGKWGVETVHSNIWLSGAGARRGGGVSGIPGYNAAQAVLTLGCT